MTQKKKVYDVNWNQLNDNATIAGKLLQRDNTEGTALVYITIGAYGKIVPPGHVVYENIIFSELRITGSSSTTMKIYQNVRGLAFGNSGNVNNPTITQDVLRYSAVNRSSTAESNCNTILRVPQGMAIDAVIESMILVDLTAIYGEGREPTDPKVFEADFERWFGYPLSYEPYDEGSVRQTLPIYRFP